MRIARFVRNPSPDGCPAGGWGELQRCFVGWRWICIFEDFYMDAFHIEMGWALTRRRAIKAQDRLTDKILDPLCTCDGTHELT